MPYVSLLSGLMICCMICNVSVAQPVSWAWAKAYGGTSYDFGSDIIVDRKGNLFMAGSYSGPFVTFGTYVLNNAGSYDIFLAKLNANGNTLWAKTTGGNGSETVFHMTRSSSGNIYLTGNFYSDSIAFGGDKLYLQGGSDAFVLAFDSFGNKLWARSIGDTLYETGVSLATDNDGNVYMAGRYSSPAIVSGSDTLLNAGGFDMMLVKYNASGTVEWVKTANSDGDDMVYSVTVAGEKVYVSGFYEEWLWIDSTVLSSAYEGMLACFDTGGNFLWVRGFDDPGYCIADSIGNLFYAGRFEYSSTEIDGIQVYNPYPSYSEIFISMLDGAGNAVWAKSAGGSHNESLGGLDCDHQGNVYLTGQSTSGSIKFGTHTVLNSNVFAIWAAKYDSAGMAAWARTAMSESNFVSSDITADDEGQAWVTGHFIAANALFAPHTIANAGGSTQYQIFAAKLIENTTTVGFLEKPASFDLIPNPLESHVRLLAPENDALTIEFFSPIGSLAARFQGAYHGQLFDISHFGCGVYVYRIVNSRGDTVQGKLVKQ